MASPIEAFFNLGNKATKGDPLNKARFDYYLYWILAGAFFYLMINYFFMFYQSGFKTYSYLAWGLVMLTITWFNYSTLTAFYNGYTNLKHVYGSLNDKNVKVEPKPESESSVKEMMGEFKKDGN